MIDIEPAAGKYRIERDCEQWDMGQRAIKQKLSFVTFDGTNLRSMVPPSENDPTGGITEAMGHLESHQLEEPFEYVLMDVGIVPTRTFQRFYQGSFYRHDPSTDADTLKVDASGSRPNVIRIRCAPATSGSPERATEAVLECDPQKNYTVERFLVRDKQRIDQEVLFRYTKRGEEWRLSEVTDARYLHGKLASTRTFKVSTASCGSELNLDLDISAGMRGTKVEYPKPIEGKEATAKIDTEFVLDAGGRFVSTRRESLGALMPTWIWYAIGGLVALATGVVVYRLFAKKYRVGDR